MVRQKRFTKAVYLPRAAARLPPRRDFHGQEDRSSGAALRRRRVFLRAVSPPASSNSPGLRRDTASLRRRAANTPRESPAHAHEPFSGRTAAAVMGLRKRRRGGAAHRDAARHKNADGLRPAPARGDADHERRVLRVEGPSRRGSADHRRHLLRRRAGAGLCANASRAVGNARGRAGSDFQNPRVRSARSGKRRAEAMSTVCARSSSADHGCAARASGCSFWRCISSAEIHCTSRWPPPICCWPGFRSERGGRDEKMLHVSSPHGSPFPFPTAKPASEPERWLCCYAQSSSR